MRSTVTTRSIANNQGRWASHTIWAAFIATIAGWGSLGSAQELKTSPPPLPTPVQPPAAPAQASGPLTISDIMAMHQAGLGDQIIIGSIQQHSMAATLGVEELISMRRHGISNEVIQAMQQRAPLPAPKAPPVRTSRRVVQPTVVEPVVQPVIVSPVYRPVYHPPVIYSHRYYHPHRHYHVPVRQTRSSFGIHVRF